MLTAAFQCPQRPDAPCLQRIGDKLKADQFLWGVMSKAPDHQVTAEVHLWARGKADQVARETYSDNLKDSNDDNLRKLAAGLFGKLLGVAGGTVALHVSSDSGTVIVDGASKVELDHGHATLKLAAGPHTIEVQAPGFASVRKSVTLEATANLQLEIELAAENAAGAATEQGKPAPVRAIVGWSAVAAGGILVATGVGFGVAYLGDESNLNNARQNNYNTGSTTPVSSPCAPPQTTLATVAGCNALNSAHSAQIGEIVTLSLGGALAAVGVFLLVTDHPAAAAPPPAKTGLSSFRLVPSVAPGSASMLVLGRF